MVLGGLSCDVDPKVKGHIMYFLINTPPPKPNTPPLKTEDVTTFAGAYITPCRWKLGPKVYNVFFHVTALRYNDIFKVSQY